MIDASDWYAASWLLCARCGHAQVQHNLIGNSGQKACGAERSATAELHCLHFVEVKPASSA